MDRYLLPSHLIASQVHWDALADILGEVETVKLYGSRPELMNTADAVEGLYFNDKAPRRSVYVGIALGLLMTCSVVFGVFHHRTQPAIPTVLDPCALVLTESGAVCR